MSYYIQSVCLVQNILIINLSSLLLKTCVSSESRMSHNSLTAIARTQPHDQHDCLHTYQLSYKCY